MQLSRLLYHSIAWRGINLLSVFVLNIVVARVLGAAAYGSLFLVINLCAFFLLLSSLSLESGLAFYTAKNALKPVNAGLFAIIWSFVASTGIAVVLYFISDPLLYESNKHLFIISFLYLCGNLLLTFFIPLFTAKQHYIIPNAVVAFINIALCLFVLVSHRFGTISAGNLIFWFLLTFFIQGVVMALFYFIHYGKPSFQPAGQAGARMIAAYSLRSFLGNMIFFLVYRVDYWLVDYFCKDKTILGNYIQVAKLVQVFFIVPSIIAATVFSVTAAGSDKAMIKNIQQLSRMIFMAVLACCTALAATGYWAFPFLFGRSFGGMYIPFLLLIPGILAIATLYPFTAFYAGTDKIKKNIIGSSLALLVIIAGDLLLIPVAGIAGAAAVSSIAYIVYELYILLQFKKEYGLSLADCFVLKKEDCKLLLTMLK